MSKLIGLSVLMCVVAMGAANAFALPPGSIVGAWGDEPFLLSTEESAILGNPAPLSFMDGDVVQYDSLWPDKVFTPGADADPAMLYPDATPWETGRFRNAAGALGADVDIDGFHKFDRYSPDDGMVALSTRGDARLGTADPTKHMRDGGSLFNRQDIVKYDPLTDTATLLFDGNLLLDEDGNPGADVNINAVSLFPAGEIILFSTDDNAFGVGPASLEYDERDVVKWDPTAETAELLLDGRMIFREPDGDIGEDEDVDAISIVADNRIVLSTTNTARLRGGDYTQHAGTGMDRYNTQVTDSDAFLVNFTTNRWRRLIFEGQNLQLASGDPGSNEDLDAIYVGKFIPEPATTTMFGLAVVAAGLRRRRG